MKPENLNLLAAASTLEELRTAIATVCMRFGDIRGIRLIPDAHGSEYLCFVELDSPEANPMMIEQLGGINYGYSVAFRIPFKQDRN